MKNALLVLVLMALSPMAFAAAPAKGLCQDEAIRHGLTSAPGIDPSSPATLVSVKLLGSKTIGRKGLETIEKYYVQTEDQGGLAASIIIVRAKNVRTLEDEVLRLDCKVINQTWIE